MALENLKQNIEIERNIVIELLIFASQLNNLERLYPYEKREAERRILIRAINSLREQLRIINSSIPEILNSISPFLKIGGEEEKVPGLIKISYTPKIPGAKKISVTVEQKNKDKFLQELSLSEETIERLKKGGKKIIKEEFMEFKKSNIYAKISNRFFFNFSNNLIEKGHFKKLNSYLRKANMPYLLITYLSMSFFSTLLAFFIGIIASVLLVIFLGNLFFLFLILIAPLAVFLSFYYYPYAEGKSIESRINQEIPFVAIHMSAIAGSGIEPTQIFKIIALGEEYPATKTELKKIINQVNIYGYDLVTALQNTARETSSKKLAELLNGMASTISGGSTLNDFLDKRAETLLFEYKLERESYTKSAETFMDIYISIMIAAPMVLTLLLVLISISGMNIGLSLNSLTLVIISIVSLINIVFLLFLHLRQPAY